MGLEIFEACKAKLWNEIIDGSANHTLYHSWEWLKIIEKHSGTKLFPLVFFDADDNKPFGAIPIFYTHKYGVKMIFSPPPGSAVTLGPILIDKGYKTHKFESSYLRFQSNIDEFIKKMKSDYTLIITSPGLIDIRPFCWANYTATPMYTYKIDLLKGETAIWENMSRSLKTNIKNARKRGIEIIESDGSGSIDMVYQSLKQRYAQQQRKLPLKLDYLRDLSNEFGPSVLKTYLAVCNNNITGSQICVIYKDTMVSWVGGSRSVSNNIEANELLTWHIITKAVQNQLRWFELEGANIPNLCDAKSRYCPESSIYFSLKKTNLAGLLAEKAYSLSNIRLPGLMSG
jgi:hypothetical protein